jgi:hypothetical protein
MKPLSRTRCQVDDTTYRLYSKGSPLWYKKPNGTFDDIDLTFNDTTSSIGDISLMDKGIMSVGKRKGNNPHKVVGVRPDKNQHLGTQQLEFSLINVELDGESQDFNVETDLEIKLSASRVNQLVKVNKSFNDFKVEFDIHNTGLEIQNSKYSSTTSIRDDFGFNLTNIGENNGNTTLGMHNTYNRLNKDIPYFDCHIGKITDDYITTGEYSLEEEFGDSNLSNYIINEDMYPNGSAVYYKNSIIFTIQSYNVDNYGDIIINKLCNIYGLEDFDDGGSGKYLTKDGKKVIGYIIYDNVFFGFINTNDIPDEIKTLFKRKSFEDTSFLDVSLEQFCSDINNVFGKNLSIEVDSNYYEPINNKFVFKVSNESFYINPPSLFDKDYNQLQELETAHSLKQNDDGSYRYTKYFSINGYLRNSYDIKYIDADLAASTSEDSYYIYRQPSVLNSSTNRYTSGFLTGARNNTTANNVVPVIGKSTTAISVTCGMLNTYSSTSSGQFGLPVTNTACAIYQNFIVFNSSGITDTVTSATFKITGRYVNTGTSTGYPSDIHIILLKSSLTGDEVADNYNDFVGHTSGWGASDVTEYSAEHVCTDSSPTEQDITLNSDARNDLKNNSSFEFGIVEKEEFYDNSYNPHGLTSLNKEHGREFESYGTNISTSSLLPYIEYTTGGVSTPTENATFFGTNF